MFAETSIVPLRVLQFHHLPSSLAQHPRPRHFFLDIASNGVAVPGPFLRFSASTSWTLRQETHSLSVQTVSFDPPSTSERMSNIAFACAQASADPHPQSLQRPSNQRPSESHMAITKLFRHVRCFSPFEARVLEGIAGLSHAYTMLWLISWKHILTIVGHNRTPLPQGGQCPASSNVAQPQSAQSQTLKPSKTNEQAATHVLMQAHMCTWTVHMEMEMDSHGFSVTIRSPYKKKKTTTAS